MGCGSSNSSTAAAPAEEKYAEPKKDGPAKKEPAKKDEEPKKEEPKKEELKKEEPKQEEPPPQDAPSASSEPAETTRKKERRMSAKTRIKELCAPGWLDAAEAYCACMAGGEQWPNNPLNEALAEAAGAEFEEARKQFETFDVDGDRHVQIDELAAAMEQLGANPGGEVTDEIREMFADADLDQNGVVDFLEFLGMMGGGEEEEEEEEAMGETFEAPPCEDPADPAAEPAAAEPGEEAP